MISSFPDTYINMKKLLSLPPNLVNSFHKIAKVNVDEWFCTSDPVGARLGSGGGTTWLIEACWQTSNICKGMAGKRKKNFVACRRSKPAVTRICPVGKDFDSDTCFQMGERAKVITKSAIPATSFI